MWFWDSTLYRTISNIRPTSEQALDDMPTASTKGASHWMVWSTSCHKITMVIVCMVDRKVSSTVYTKGVQKNDQEVQLTYLAKDGEEGFPGNLQCTVTMKLTDDNAIDIQYEAETDKPTIVNMTNHSYFNLDGDPTTDNSAYLLTLNADNYTPIDSTFMTTGEIATVEGTPMDFRKPTAIGANINQEFEQLKSGNGIDHNWVLNTQGDVTKVCATLESPKTGIVLDVYTNEPGIQVYCGNFLDGTLTGKKGIVYNFRAAVCSETDKYPDTPNKPEWPSAVLRPGEKYQSQCIYKFSVHK